MSFLKRGMMRHWFAVEATPIYVLVGGACIGASWYLYRLATGPSVVWTKTNPQPWNSISQSQGTKLLEVNHKFDDHWKRDKL
ncbi:hypothetical protein FB45DRAFT_1023274 [Roridomyces roridus]|uniref:NADH dehydrogenase [ubiquinone] 1 alpha subcomplex subunit 4 n=1 Tax=Roridomyces roridus TaxID=1738132 RepID=A0AAD7C3Y1_9AGAR|nr:hypothetical protein FB45DRAFT_1023274 [Roridomyces roridus]